MNNELENALVNIINETVRAEEFILSEMPEIIEQLLFWKSVESITFTVLSFICFIAAITSQYYCRKSLKIGHNDDAILYTVISILLVVIAITLFDSAFIQIWLAPKVYLIEYAAELIK